MNILCLMLTVKSKKSDFPPLYFEKDLEIDKLLPVATQVHYLDFVGQTVDSVYDVVTNTYSMNAELNVVVNKEQLPDVLAHLHSTFWTEL